MYASGRYQGDLPRTQRRSQGHRGNAKPRKKEAPWWKEGHL